MSNLSPKENLRLITTEKVAEVLKQNGRFQIALLIFLSVNNAIVGISHTLTSFHGYTPQFYCKDTGNETIGCSAGNNTCPHGYIFAQDDHTIVSEWQLVCSRTMLKALVPTLYFCGVTLGSVIFGPLTDKYGRRPILYLCLYVQAILGFVLMASNSLLMFIIVRTIQGMFIQGLQSSSFTLLLECVSPNHRTFAATVWEVFWPLGCGLLGGISYAIPEWHRLQIALTMPVLLTLAYSWIIPESPCWLTAKDKFLKAQRVAQRIAKFNGNPVSISQNPRLTLPDPCENLVKEESDSSSASSDHDKQSYGVLQLFRNKLLRKHVVVMIGVWFSVTICYYGILYYQANLSGQRHLNFLYGAAIEVVAYIISYFALSRFGRRSPLFVNQLFSGCICITVATIVWVDVPQDGWIGILMTILVLLAKGFAVSCFCIMYLYTTELFPTVVRGAAFGICGFWSRIGSLLSPQLTVLGEYTLTSLPLICLGVSSLLAAASILTLPETWGMPLPNTIIEAEELFRKGEKIIIDSKPCTVIVTGNDTNQIRLQPLRPKQQP